MKNGKSWIMKTGPILALVALCACGRGKEKTDTATRAAPAQPSAPAARKAVFPEAEAAGVLRAISDAEIAVASVALGVTQSDAVLAYSRVIAADYRGIAQLLDSTTVAIGQTAAENALSAELRTAGDSIANGLLTLPSGFNNTFIEEQVKANRRALQLMDTALIPSARNPQLKNLFIAIRPTIAAHLQRSMQILSERRKAAEEAGEPWESGFNVAPAVTAVEAPEGEAPAPDTVPPDTIPR
jgi:putative membrane protein